MPETEQEHVERVMKHLNVKTVVVTNAQVEHTYINGRLLPGIPDLDPYTPHVICTSNGEEDWDCAVYSTGIPLPEHLQSEESI